MSVENSDKRNIEWKNETESMQDNARVYLQEYMNKSRDEKSENESPTDFHISGLNPSVMSKIRNGLAVIDRVDILYENNKPTQVHIVFGSEGTGHNLDVYLQGKTVEYFFAEKTSDVDAA